MINARILNDWIKDSSIDILINNAGILINKPFPNINYQDYKSVMDVNFWGAFNVIANIIRKII